LRPLALEGRCVDMVVVGGVYHRRHDDILLVPACFSRGMGAASCGARQYAGTGGVEEGQPSVCVRVSMKKYPFSYHKRQTILFIIRRKMSKAASSPCLRPGST